LHGNDEGEVKAAAMSGSSENRREGWLNAQAVRVTAVTPKASPLRLVLLYKPYRLAVPLR